MKKCFFIDVDGVLTNGTKSYSDNGMPSFKTYYDKDFTALKLLKAMSYDVVLVSGDDFINKRMAENRNIRFISSRNLDKADVIKDYLKKNYDGVDVLTYGIGDDIFDFSMLEFVDTPYCPSDASLYIKQYVENTFWPAEKPGWTSAAVILAADSIYKFSNGSEIFLKDDLI